MRGNNPGCFGGKANADWHLTCFGRSVTCNRMPKPDKKSAQRAKVASHRRRLRAQGLRPVQVWVPDVRTARFAAEAERQCRLANRSPQEAEDLAFIEAALDWKGLP